LRIYGALTLSGSESIANDTSAGYEIEQSAPRNYPKEQLNVINWREKTLSCVDLTGFRAIAEQQR
jgi:hypothetical protein